MTAGIFVIHQTVRRLEVELSRFRGPLTIVRRRCPDGRKTSPLRAGVPAPDGVRVALVRPHSTRPSLNRGSVGQNPDPD